MVLVMEASRSVLLERLRGFRANLKCAKSQVERAAQRQRDDATISSCGCPRRAELRLGRKSYVAWPTNIPNSPASAPRDLDGHRDRWRRGLLPCNADLSSEDGCAAAR